MEGIEGIFHVNINCSNLEHSVAFYKMLGFNVVQDMPSGGGPKLDKGMGLTNIRCKGVLMAIGKDPRSTLLDLIEWEAPKTEGKPYPPSGPHGHGPSRVAHAQSAQGLRGA